MEELVLQARKFVDQALDVPPPPPPRSLSHSTWSSQLSDLWLVHALHRYPVTGQHMVSHVAVR